MITSAKLGLKAIGKDVKPVSDELYLHLSPQIQQLHQMALYFAVELQAKKPDSAVARLAIERNSRVRIFENHRKSPPIDFDRKISVSSKDLPPDLGNLIKRAFLCYDELLDGRHEGDEHKIWRARSEERQLQRDIKLRVVSGELPPAIPLLLKVSERLACATKKRGWKDVLEECIKEAETEAPKRGG